MESVFKKFKLFKSFKTFQSFKSWYLRKYGLNDLNVLNCLNAIVCRSIELDNVLDPAALCQQQLPVSFHREAAGDD